MSLLEGGPLTCGTHKFEAKNVDDWNKHWVKYGVEDGHYEQGKTNCTTCGVRISYTHLPPRPYVNGSKNIQLQCEDCRKETVGKAKIETTGKAGGKK